MHARLHCSDVILYFCENPFNINSKRNGCVNVKLQNINTDFITFIMKLFSHKLRFLFNSLNVLYY